MMAENKINVEKIQTYSLRNLNYKQIDCIYRAVLAFEPSYPGGEETRGVLLEALRGVIDGRK